MSLFEGINAKAERFLLPRRFQCLHCGALSDGEILCPECANALEIQRLQDPTDQELPDTVAVYAYRGLAASMVLRLKYHRHREAAELLAEEMAALLARQTLPADVTVTSVPMPRHRLEERGIDHAWELAKWVAAKNELPCEILLKRIGQGHTQYGLSGEERRRNLRGAFRAVRPCGGTIVLVDDVRTTGTTLTVCREALLSGGAERVICLTATRTSNSAPEDEAAPGKTTF